MKSVHKVWLYIVRVRDAQPELLVFEHTHVDAGIQIPAGTVEPDEDFAAAAQRELFEESGIQSVWVVPFGDLQRVWNGESIHAHWFCGRAPEDAPDEWRHRVTGGGEDNGMTFRCYWLPKNQWHNLFGNFKSAYPALEPFITREFSTETT